MKFYSDDYYTIVAENLEQAKKFFLSMELTDEDFIDEVREIDPDKKMMWFPLEDLPEKYHDEEKYPRSEIWEYVGVKITLTEALKYSKEKPPFIICISSDIA